VCGSGIGSVEGWVGEWAGMGGWVGDWVSV